jgi:hypothetical protein
MTIRSADATIKGYYYQFDTSILKILELKNDSDSITVEGIEDIDISTATETTAVQCKYLSKPNYINSAVRKPIILMIDHFINPKTPNNLKYILYAHFENETQGNEPLIDLVKLKEILTYSEQKTKKHYEIENGISDNKLKDFLNQFKFIFGKEFKLQQAEVVQKLKAFFNCSDFEADTLYYNNALRIIVDKSIEKNLTKRNINKGDFIKTIDCSKKLFNEWFIKIRTKKAYLNLSSNALKSTRALEPLKTKTIILGKEILVSDNTELPIHTFIDNLISKFYRLNHSMRNSKPLILVLDYSLLEIKELKKILIDNEVIFNDGYEHLKFSPLIFNKEPIINTNKNGVKISKSSYLIKLISLESFIKNTLVISKPSVFLNFSKQDFDKNLSIGQFFDFKHCEDLKDVNKLLKL